LKTSPKIQVFASDLDERSLVRAREGVYPAAIEADVSPERLRRFFIAEGDFYRIRQDMRNMVLFATHSVLRDPPFSRVDLISCRNLLIYLQREIQENVFEIFHYALNPEGYLFLGNSESAEMLPEVFHTLDKSHRIYQAKPWQGGHPHVPTLPLRVDRTDIPDLLIKNESRSLRRLANNALTLHSVHQEALEANSPPSILIDEEYNVLHVSETAGRYLLQPKGPLASNLVQLVRLELKQDLRSSLFQAYEKNAAEVSLHIAVIFKGETHRFNISERPHDQEENQTGVKKRVGLVIFM
jgi:two-component system CheB/CheR fusion protein